MKYDQQLTELKKILPASKSILIAVPANANIDQLAAGLSIFLTLEAQGKQVTIVSDDTIKVSQSYLFGIDHVQKNLPQTNGGNLTITLEGVAAANNTIPALEKLDWFAENNNLNLVFHVLPGQTFQPAKIVPHYQGSGFDVIFVVGAVNLNALGNIYSANPQTFSGIHVVNVDIQPVNTGFGQTNILDTNASSVSEIVSSIISDLGYTLTSDPASNLLAGIFDATSNLTNSKANAETFMAVANCLRVGGRKPTQPQVQPQAAPSYDWSALMPAQQGEPQNQSASDYTVPPVTPSVQTTQSTVDQGDDFLPANASQPSPEERPSEEGVASETVEPEWLTPKIFKGSSIG